METAALVASTRSGQSEAFTELVKRYQNLALGYAFSLVGDFDKAQDIVQESFFIAHQNLYQLKNAQHFASWLRGIVYFRCQRQFRNPQNHFLSLDTCKENSSEEEISIAVQKKEEKEFLLRAIQSLPEMQRTIITLFYLEERSQEEVSLFLGISKTKVNNSLHQARKRLKDKLFIMAKDTFKEKRLSEEFAKNIGEIVAIQGCLVDTKVVSGHTARIFDTLGSNLPHTKNELLVIQRLKNGMIRCISNKNHLKPRAKLYHSGIYQHGSTSIHEDTIKEAVEKIKGTPQNRILETGIKVLDLLCPITHGASVGVFGKEGVGRAVLVMELLARKEKLQGEISIFFYVSLWNILGTQDMLETEPGFATDLHENIQTAWIVHPNAGDPFYGTGADYLDVRLYCSPLKAAQGLWPAIEPLYCVSKSLTPGSVGKEHYEVAKDVLDILQKSHEMMRDPLYLEYVSLGAYENAKKQYKEFFTQRINSLSQKEKQIVTRAKRLEHFFTQPFYVAEDFIKKPGNTVKLSKTIEGTKRILSGEFDQVPVETLSFQGGI